MIRIRKAQDRGASNLDWLDSKHTFSFGRYQDPEHIGFETLKVINDDIVAPAKGFGTHPHDNMEIISYVLDGAVEHKDSMGNGSVILPGDVQRLSAGTGITHSEFNPLDDQSAHFLQIWFMPKNRNIVPSYAQKSFPEGKKRGKFCLVASEDGRDNSVSLNQDVDMYVGLLNGNEAISYEISHGRNLWIHIARGNVTVNDYQLSAGDGVAITDLEKLDFEKGNHAEILVFDMATTKTQIN